MCNDRLITKDIDLASNEVPPLKKNNIINKFLNFWDYFKIIHNKMITYQQQKKLQYSFVKKN